MWAAEFEAKLEKFNNFNQTLQHHIFLWKHKLILEHFRFEVKYLSRVRKHCTVRVGFLAKVAWVGLGGQ